MSEPVVLLSITSRKKDTESFVRRRSSPKDNGAIYAAGAARSMPATSEPQPPGHRNVEEANMHSTPIVKLGQRVAV